MLKRSNAKEIICSRDQMLKISRTERNQMLKRSNDQDAKEVNKAMKS